MPKANGETRKHVAVFAFPFATHAALLLSFVRKISESAPDVMFSFFNTEQSNDTIFSNYSGDSGKVIPRSVDNGLPKGYVPKEPFNEQVAYFLKATPGNFKRAVDEVGLPVDFLITDAFLWFGKEMSEEMKVPWLSYWTSGTRAFLLHVYTDDIRARMGIDGPGDKTLDFLPGYSTTRAMDLPEGIVFGSLDSPIAVMVHKMGQMVPHASAVAINSFEELDPIVVQTLKSRIPNLYHIGPFMLKSPPLYKPDILGCLDWLDQHPKSSVVYISFGSMVTPPPHELKALTEALEACEFPFLWSFRGNAEQLLPKGFLERTKEKGLVVAWTPQLKVLEHASVGAFLTHCGWNSAIESIIGNVPMICRPYFGDHKLNQRTVECVWGSGVGLEGGELTKDGIIKAMKMILSSKEGELVREKIAALKQLAFKAVDVDGSSTLNFNSIVKLITKS